jgi:hypothetical protein
MNPTSFGLACAGLGISLVVWVGYLATVPSGKVPRRPIAHIALQSIALAAAIMSIVGSVRAEAPSVLVATLAITGITVSSLFLFLLTQRVTPVGQLRARVGDALLPFAAVTSDGAPFHSDSFAGRRVLLKFFRGHW